MPTRTLSITAVELIPGNTLRKSLVFQNGDTTDSIFIKQERAEVPTVSASDHDHRIGPGGSMSLNFGTDGKETTQARWTGVASANTPRIAYFETEDIVR